MISPRLNDKGARAPGAGCVLHSEKYSRAFRRRRGLNAGLWIVLKASSDEILESFALAFLFGVDGVEVAFELLVCLGTGGKGDRSDKRERK